jgi:hypothetical protein
MSNRPLIAFGRSAALSLVAMPALAYDVNEQLSIGGVLAGAIQCQDLSDAPDVANTCRGAVPFQPELSFRPGDSHEVFLKLGFAAGNGLNDRSPFVIAPWAADVEEDVKDINGRKRDHLLTAWYKYIHAVSDSETVGVTIGIIDATDYLDENAFAGDEYTQFMNSVLTNGPNVFLPSYDYGAALEWDRGPWSLRGVFMEIGENDDGNRYRFYGLQAGLAVNNRLGAGNYRIAVASASRDFLDPDGTGRESRAGVVLSLDQEFGAVIGGWTRIGWQTDDAAVEYSAIYSGGIDIKGSPWGRDDDNIGVGLAYLSGGSLDIDKSLVAEVYYRLQLADALGLAADIQYQEDDVSAGRGASGWTVGLRAVMEF